MAAVKVTVTDAPELRVELLTVVPVPAVTVQFPPVTERVVVGLGAVFPARVSVTVVDGAVA